MGYNRSGILTVLLVIAVIHVATSENKKSYFDEGSNMGGAIRPMRYARSHDEAGGVCRTTECKRVAKYIKDSMDVSVDPCDDFYDYACGGWLKKNPLPRGSPLYGTFNKLNEQIQNNLKKILQNGISDIDGASEELMRMPSDIYDSCMDLAAIDKVGDAPLKKLIQEIGGWGIDEESGDWDEKNWDFNKVLLYIHREYTSGGGPLFSVYITDDSYNNSRHIIEIDQAGPQLSMEVYVDKPEIVKAYKRYIIDVGKLLSGRDTIARKTAKEIIEFETKLAKISVPKAEKIDNSFNKMTIEKLTEEAPDFDWLKHLNKMVAPDVVDASEIIIVPALPYLKKVMRLVKITPKRVLANYLVWSMIIEHVPYLSKPYRNAFKQYRQRKLGVKGQEKRWKTCISYTNDFVGDILSAAYVRKHFAQDSKDRAKEMIKGIRQAFKENVNSLPWMDRKTKLAVSEKANAMNDEVGYPDYLTDSSKFVEKFKKYNSVVIRNDALFSNRIAIYKMDHLRMLTKLRKSVDREEWQMLPQTINAMYDFQWNGMIIPAAILHPPFFYSKDIPCALSFGAIGTVIGHEMTHGFDNRGRQFNKKGEIAPQWWTNSSLEEYNTRIQCVEKQYSQYKVAGEYPISGKKTLGENIADNGGFKATYKAYRNWINKKGKTTLKLPGLDFTDEQLIFIGFGQSFCVNSTPKQQYLATLNDPHADTKFRIIGVFSNSHEFSKAFKCKLNSPMNPSKKCSVWSKEGAMFE